MKRVVGGKWINETRIFEDEWIKYKSLKMNKNNFETNMQR